MNAGLGLNSVRLRAGLSDGLLSFDAALQFDDSAFIGVEVVTSLASEFAASALSLPTRDFSLGQASSLPAPAVRPDGGATVTGWREAPAESVTSAAQGLSPEIATVAVTDPVTGSEGSLLQSSGPPGIEAHVLGRPSENPANHFAVHDMDARVLLVDDADIFDFDQLHLAPERPDGIVAGTAPETAMILPPGLGEGRLDISQAVLEAYGGDHFEAGADLGRSLATIDAGSIFESSSPTIVEPMQFVAFDSSAPTPIIASIEWGG